MKILKLQEKDIKQVAVIAAESFSGLNGTKKAKKWIECNFKAFPRMQYFVVKEKGKVAGYALWVEKGGFRNESVFELEQLAVDGKFRGMGFGTELILKSFEEIKKYLKKRKSTIKLVEVTTGTDNRAQHLYEKTLGAKAECVVKDFFRGDEVIMIARFK